MLIEDKEFRLDNRIINLAFMSCVYSLLLIHSLISVIFSNDVSQNLQAVLNFETLSPTFTLTSICVQDELSKLSSTTVQKSTHF